MKKFAGVKNVYEKEETAKKLGWETYEDKRFNLRMKKNIEGMGEIDVCSRSFGKFFVYVEGVCIGSERSEELENVEWYEELLSIFYKTESEEK